MRVSVLACVIAASTVMASAAGADEAPATPRNCFDAGVYAIVTQEIPSDIPMYDDKSIVVRWPWFIDLQVERVEYGSVRHGTVTVLTMQHTYLKPRYGLWWLRRNSAGGFNVVGLGETDLAPCPEDATPVAPYIGGGKDQTLDDLRRAGERRYGRFPY
jgi:hypothetical protein